MSGEAFSILKLLRSPMTGLFWVKTIMFAFGIGFIGFVCFGVYKAYFKKPDDTQKQVVKIVSPQAGANINIGQQNEEKREWLDPFSEVFIEGTKGIHGDKDYGAKIGIRIGLRF
jgi:hypothetical protein